MKRGILLLSNKCSVLHTRRPSSTSLRVLPLSTAVTGLSVPTKWAIWGFVALLGGGYLWAAPAKQALTPHLSHLVPLLSLARIQEMS